MRDQRGAALLILLMLIITAGSFLLLKAVKTSPLERDKITAAALAQAKDALIGYAVTYRDNGHPNEVFGYLPLPDLGSSRNNGTTEEGKAAENFTGNGRNMTVIGRLPWQTLGLPALRDSQGECLWYAVSGSFQYAIKAKVLNWDSIGHFDVYTSDGTTANTVSTTGTNYSQRPVAIIFSAGAVLPGQNRQASTTDTITTCGGNYDARNYLDSFSADGNINNIVNYLTGANNATGYAYSLTNIADGSQLDATALAAPKNIIFGNITTSLGKIVNDRILVITADDIFSRVKKRSDFADQIKQLLDDVEFTSYVKTVPLTGAKGTDSVNCNAIITNTSNKKFCANWKELLLLTALPSPQPPACNRVLIFGGQKTGAQVRQTITDKADPTNYLEGVNVAAFAMPLANSSGFDFSATTFNAVTPSSDILKCIP